MSQLSLKKIKLGDNADLSKNFVISVPAVADGTLTIERENGTDVLTVDVNGKVTCTLADNLLPLGVGQTWQDVSGIRIKGTVYQNSTGRPIEVSIAFSTPTATYAYIDVGPTNAVTLRLGQVGVANMFAMQVFVVPAGWYYRISETGGTITIANWKELR